MQLPEGLQINTGASGADCQAERLMNQRVEDMIVAAISHFGSENIPTQE